MANRKNTQKIFLAGLVFAAAGAVFLWQANANPNLPGDINNDNTVNLTDLSILLSNWNRTITPGPGPTPPTPTPPNPNPNVPAGSDGPVDASECGETAADKLGWGEPAYQSHFNTPSLDPRWHPYGPEPGHAGNGTRTPAAFTVANGNVTIDGKSDGSTGAMKFFPGQKYGRWEGCMKVGTNGNTYHALFLHWPDAEDFPVGGEIDWAEIFEDRNEVNWFLHYGPDNDQDHGSVNMDSTQWHSWAMEWTPSKMTAYVDGEEWYSTTDTGTFPPRPMDWCIQLDNFGDGGTSSMVVDWTKQWAIPESQPSTMGLKPGEPATGQPEDYPERVPRPMSVNEMLGKQ